MIETHAFADRGGMPLHLDLHHPGGGERPLVVYAYGGGFVKGSRGDAVHRPVIDWLCQAGFAVAVPDYRLGTGPADVVPATLAEITRFAARARREGVQMRRRLYGVRLYTACEDLSDALRFLAAKATALGVRAERTGLLGVSAGGLAGNTLCYPPAPWRDRLMAPAAMVALAAPVVHGWRLKAGGVPLLIVHGRRDRIVPAADSVLTARAAERAGAPVEVRILRRCPHVGITDYLMATPAASGEMHFDGFVSFLRRHIA